MGIVAVGRKERPLLSGRPEVVEGLFMKKVAGESERGNGRKTSYRRSAVIVATIFVALVLLFCVFDIVVYSLGASRARQAAEATGSQAERERINSIENLLGGSRTASIVILL